MHQCLLEKVGDNATQMVAWIEVPSNHHNVEIQLLDGDEVIGFYRIKEIYQPTYTSKQLNEKQSYDRKGFPSTKKEKNNS